MTDNEIIKALECCINDDCDNCPDTFGNCEHNAMRNSLDLINHQKAEIERLKEEREMLLKECKRCGRRKDKRTRKLKNQLKTARKKAIKEFAERLKKRFYSFEYKVNTKRTTLPLDFVKDQMEWIFTSVCAETIDNLVKEMTEEMTESEVEKE